MYNVSYGGYGESKGRKETGNGEGEGKGDFLEEVARKVLSNPALSAMLKSMPLIPWQRGCSKTVKQGRRCLDHMFYQEGCDVKDTLATVTETELEGALARKEQADQKPRSMKALLVI